MEYKLPVLSDADVVDIGDKGNDHRGDRKKRSVRIVPYGKADAIRREDPETGTIYAVCLCQYNVELSDTGCVFQVDADQLEETVLHQGSYSPENTKRYQESGDWPQNKCNMCYASWYNSGNVLERVVDEVTRGDFEKFSPGVVRLGKKTETGHPWYWNVLGDFLDITKEFNASTIFITRALPFGIEGAVETSEHSKDNNEVVARLSERNWEVGDSKEMVDRLIGAKTSLLYSMAWNIYGHEKGAFSQGFTDDWKLSQARKYADAGVNTALTVVCDVTSSIEENHQRGNAIKMSLDSGLPVRILPLRPNREIIAETCGGGWSDLVGRVGHQSLFDQNIFPYHPKGKGRFAVASTMHPDFQSLLENGTGFCGETRIPGEEAKENCDHCGIRGNRGDDGKPVFRTSFPVGQLVPLQYDMKTRGKEKKGKSGLKDEDNGHLFTAEDLKKKD